MSGMAAPCEDECAVLCAALGPSDVGLTVVVGVGWPLVKGCSLAALPEKPGAPAVALSEGAEVLLGLRTLGRVRLMDSRKVEEKLTYR